MLYSFDGVKLAYEFYNGDLGFEEYLRKYWCCIYDDEMNFLGYELEENI